VYSFHGHSSWRIFELISHGKTPLSEQYPAKLPQKRHPLNQSRLPNRFGNQPITEISLYRSSAELQMEREITGIPVRWPHRIG
jgi:hypothetical protein